MCVCESFLLRTHVCALRQPRKLSSDDSPCGSWRFPEGSLHISPETPAKHTQIDARRYTPWNYNLSGRANLDHSISELDRVDYMRSFYSCSVLGTIVPECITYRDHFLLAVVWQVSNAINKEFISIGVCPAGLDHPAAQLHQLMERNRQRERDRVRDVWWHKV